MDEGFATLDGGCCCCFCINKGSASPTPSPPSPRSPSPSVARRASWTQVMMGPEWRVCCEEGVADTDCGAEPDASAPLSTLSAVAAHGHWAVVLMPSLRCCLQKQCNATATAALQWGGCWPIPLLPAAEPRLRIDAHQSPAARHLT